jgi:hypothetical protein
MNCRVRPAIFVTTAIACLTAQAVGATGIELEFDGERQYFIPEMAGARTGFTRFLNVDAVSMEGKNGPARVVLEFSFTPGARTGDTPYDARISFRPDGWRNYWVSPAEFPSGAILIEHLDLSGPMPHIKGKFTVPLCFTKSPIHPPDMTRCQMASGVFATELVPD